jgi:hypothetical protein
VISYHGCIYFISRTWLVIAVDDWEYTDTAAARRPDLPLTNTMPFVIFQWTKLPPDDWLLGELSEAHGLSSLRHSETTW